MDKNKKIIVLFLLIYIQSLQTAFANKITCPIECKCGRVNGKNRVDCVSAKLITVDQDYEKGLQVLNVTKNYIAKLDANSFELSDFSKLEILNISHNQISIMELRSFERLENLVLLDLSYNNIQYVIPTLFLSNKQLKELYLKGNSLGMLQNSPFLVSNSLEVLDISECKIRFLAEKTFSQLGQLKSINLRNNFFTRMNLGVLENLNNLHDFMFSAKHLTCNEQWRAIGEHCAKNNIRCDKVCMVVEKFQKMIALPMQTTTEEPEFFDSESWDFSQLSENLTSTTENLTKDVVEEKQIFSVLWLVLSSALLSFAFGAIFGCFLTILCKEICRRPRTLRPNSRRARLRSFSQNRISSIRYSNSAYDRLIN